MNRKNRVRSNLRKKYNRRLKWRPHLALKSQDYYRGDWSGLFKFSEFFFCYLKFTTRAEWEGGKTKQATKIEYRLTTQDDWVNAPPQFKIAREPFKFNALVGEIG